MWFFSQKSKEESKDEAILRLNARIFKVENEVLELCEAQKTIREKILKKMKGKIEEEETETKNLYNKVLLPE